MSTQWCFTFNNYSMDDVHRLRALHTDPRNKLAYICFQPELAPNTGTPHLQGFIAFESRKRFSTVKRLLGDSTHLETPRGTPEQNRTYCSKDESRDNDAGFGFHEAGDLPSPLEQGKRNDLLAFKAMLDEGYPVWDVPNEDPALFGTAVRYHRGLSQYELHSRQPRQERTHLHVHTGDPGTFKSHAASQYPSIYPLENGNNGSWFDAYDPNRHESVLIDEFGGHFMPYTELKRLADRYPKMVETKGGRTIFRAKRIIITSNISAESWYKQPFEELERRITSWFDYRRSDVPMYGLSFGSIFIELKKGDWKHHPLQDYLHQPHGS
jgi:hypothetical protein